MNRLYEGFIELFMWSKILNKSVMLFKAPDTNNLEIAHLMLEDNEMEYYYFIEKPVPKVVFCRSGFNEEILEKLKNIGLEEVLSTNVWEICELLASDLDDIHNHKILWRNYIYVNGILDILDIEYMESIPEGWGSVFPYNSKENQERLQKSYKLFKEYFQIKKIK